MKEKMVTTGTFLTSTFIDLNVDPRFNFVGVVVHDSDMGNFGYSWSKFISDDTFNTTIDHIRIGRRIKFSELEKLALYLLSEMLKDPNIERVENLRELVEARLEHLRFLSLSNSEYLNNEKPRRLISLNEFENMFGLRLNVDPTKNSISLEVPMEMGYFWSDYDFNEREKDRDCRFKNVFERLQSIGEEYRRSPTILNIRDIQFPLVDILVATKALLIWMLYDKELTNRFEIPMVIHETLKDIDQYILQNGLDEVNNYFKVLGGERELND